MSADLAARIEAALDEKQRIAEEATQGPWKLWGMEVRADQVGNSDLDDSYLVARTFDETRGLRTFNANHIAANSPASVLRLVAGMRKILDLHPQSTDEVHSYECATCGDEGQTLDCTYPCDTIRSLASMLGVDEGEK